MLGPGLVRGGVVTAVVASTVTGPRQFECRIARLESERAAYFELRRSIFCAEQKLFVDDDRDGSDRTAHPIVCVASAPGARSEVVGVVRIWEESPGHWWGGRLGVARSFRSEGVIGRRLVHTAVGIARAWGATRFRATVQQANVVFFRRLRWRSLEEMEVLGQPHHLMEANLDTYPLVPVDEPRDEVALHSGLGRDAA
jgi:putative N-acetyltransferase (TIGR04045 family)